MSERQDHTDPKEARKQLWANPTLYLVLRRPGDTETPTDRCPILELSPQILDSVLPRSGRKGAKHLRAVVETYVGSPEASRAEPQDALESFLPGLLGDSALHIPYEKFEAARARGDIASTEIVAVWTQALTPTTSSA